MSMNTDNKYLIAFTAMLGTFMEVVDTSVANVALPHMAGTYSAGVDEITWVITSYLVANAVILPMTGWLGNYFGRKRLLMVSVGLNRPFMPSTRPALAAGLTVA